MDTKKPTILITNDDGFTAPGISALVEAMMELGNVIVLAPDKPQSGMGHAITINDPLRLKKLDFFGEVEAYSCSGTPVDCVKIAKDKILHHKPDLCVSGINHGSNSSINIIYSGTMSAALEASIEGIPAIGFSLLDYSHSADFSAAKKYAYTIAKQVLEFGLPDNVLLNVNIPALPFEEIAGMRICRQAVAKWEEEYDERLDPTGKKYYWLTGKFVNYDKGDDTDEWALANNYVSIVPVQFDLTAHHAIAFFNKHWNVGELLEKSSGDTTKNLG
ncbi:MAG: 5'/3'-nucleotidase SurE [Bacteroidetes bacterium]|nr:5'/3'-nucleotidase SurE [Bacteroidota bacterium]MBK8487044.1 5'/3'-nucleotidase SurE [Bacteroidota bacterium]MBP9549704.1 5'/3'-nucleotidase SurE [Chitinophagales bacterium]